MSRRSRGLRSCKRCGAPSHRALCGQCNPNRSATEHVDKYASAQLRPPGELIDYGGGFDPESGGFERLPEGF